ncbi:MAG: acetyl/propionyl-CoA carboxylase subunit alpha [Pseudonocardiales bacterium]|nr:MAG: acetyl/propionyl-CoA carboxylase subunit alpha [Pseudonocardiales bacterium]
MLTSVLVANRGEIAVRVIRTLHRLGIRSIAVFSDADADASHVRDADTAVRLGPPPAALSYLDANAVIAAARRTGAQAIHPGYGFLSENAGFARACADAGIVFIGPPAEAIDTMGDKIAAKARVAAAGVPVVPGRGEPGMDDAALRTAAIELGLPVLVKPSAGGGGKGMRLVRAEAELVDAIAGARREARASFGDDTLLVERFVTDPRHIEIQVMADAHGGVIHLGERECSLQRRHQKIVEEAPSALLSADQRASMGAAAVEAARSVGYTGAGTVEFIVDGGAPDHFFFMEMNTRLQVEHPVTEMVTGYDLVELQLRVAADEPLRLTQSDIAITGHAVEARVYAEDPARGFLPSAGKVLALREPTGEHVRVDSALRQGITIGTDYDPMLAKVVAWAPDRSGALRRLDTALGQTAVLGLHTNVEFLRRLVRDDDVVAGNLDTGLVERRIEQLSTVDGVEPALVAAAVARLVVAEPAGAVVDPFDIPGGWRVGEHAWTSWSMRAGGDAVEVRARGRCSGAEIAVGDGTAHRVTARLDGDLLAVTADGVCSRYLCAVDGPWVWLARDGAAWAVYEQERLQAARRESSAGGGGPVVAPLPGVVVEVRVATGDRVIAGATLVVVEAMKMEHTLTAPIDGVVGELRVHKGQTVAMDEVLAVVVGPDER